ncbi:Type IV secretion protein Rhs [Pseudomonas sp. IT-P253]|uniref:calcium-binding protein n=1 Tax=Pseudomonas sp. IT-P253 TaxID=3026455 RepID=UPI0039E0A4FC
MPETSIPRRDASSPPVRVSEIDTPHTADRPALDTQTSNNRRQRLSLQDAQFGEVLIGEMTVSRVELYELGTRLNGHPISANDCEASTPDQAFIDALRLDPDSVQSRLLLNDQLPALLFEIASQRSPRAQSLLTSISDSSPDPLHNFGSLLDSAQQLTLAFPDIPDNLPSWVDRLKSRSMTSVGIGMQAYGIYSGILGTADALRKSDIPEALLNTGGIAAEGVSLFVEHALENTGRAMLKNGGTVFNGFSATSAGKWLARSAGLIASAVTLPFDIYSAIKAFDEASSAKGKSAQDLYVNGSLSVISAGLSVALGVAALAGFSSAGPVGIVAGALLIMGATIYGAARQVDDIDDFIELSTHERWRSGWFAFTGQTLDSHIMDRYLIARTDDSYGKQMTEAARQWLEGELKNSVDAVVLGKYEVVLQPARHWKLGWDAASGGAPYVETKEPVVQETDDVYDAREGIHNVPNAIMGSSAENKAIFWQLGDGDDRVTGVRHKPNFFSYAADSKVLVGGDKDDHFLFQGAAKLLETSTDTASVLLGGPGNDSLQLQGKPGRNNVHTGFRIDLQEGFMSLRSNPDLDFATLGSIENVETLAGARSEVIGNERPNKIILRGSEERAEGGAGDDELITRGFNCTLDGGTGADRYLIGDDSGATVLNEDGLEDSRIEMDWPFERIQSWRIEGTSLVIVVLRGADGELPEISVTISNVYQPHTSGRELKNDKLLFITQDGYSLKPDLPQTLPALASHTIKVIIVTPGRGKPPPTLLKGGTYALPALPDRSYFVCRHQPSTVLNVEPSSLITALHLDYDSGEIEAMQIHYTVTSTRKSNFDYLHYTDISLTMRLSDQKQLTLTPYARNRVSTGTHVGGSLIASGSELARQLLLTMRDGKSYRLQPPNHSYVDDHRHPGDKLMESKDVLMERTGHYVLAAPATHPAILLSPQAQRVDIDATPQTAIVVLLGQAAAYDVYPPADSLLRLSTPGAATRASGGSTWTIHTEHLGATIEHADIRLEGSLLRVGNIHIIIPRHDAPEVPMENIHVHSSAGHQYDVDLEFDLIHLAQLNARAYASPDNLLTDLRHQQHLDVPMVDLLPIQDLRLGSGRPGALFYDSETQNLIVDSDWSRVLTAEDVYITPPPGPATKA